MSDNIVQNISIENQKRGRGRPKIHTQYSSREDYERAYYRNKRVNAEKIMCPVCNHKAIHPMSMHSHILSNKHQQNLKQSQ